MDWKAIEDELRRDYREQYRVVTELEQRLYRERQQLGYILSDLQEVRHKQEVVA